MVWSQILFYAWAQIFDVWYAEKNIRIGQQLPKLQQML